MFQAVRSCETTAVTGFAAISDVRRLSGLLPPGVTKRITGDAGATYLFGVLFGRFRVVSAGDDHAEFHYRLWPITDHVHWTGSRWEGEGRVFGVRFCRFWMELREV